MAIRVPLLPALEAMADIMVNTVEKLKLAQAKEEKEILILDLTVCLLRKHIHATGGHIMASDQARY